MKITAETTLTELAAIISDTLESKNVIATLSGGAAVSIYSKNLYQSADLDFVTAAPIDVLKDALEPLGSSIQAIHDCQCSTTRKPSGMLSSLLPHWVLVEPM